MEKNFEKGKIWPETLPPTTWLSGPSFSHFRRYYDIYSEVLVCNLLFSRKYVSVGKACKETITSQPQFLDHKTWAGSHVSRQIIYQSNYKYTGQSQLAVVSTDQYKQSQPEPRQ